MEEHAAALLHFLEPGTEAAAAQPTHWTQGSSAANSTATSVGDLDELAARLVLDDSFKITRSARIFVFQAAVADKSVLFRSTAVKVMTDLVARVQDQNVLEVRIVRVRDKARVVFLPHDGLIKSPKTVHHQLYQRLVQGSRCQCQRECSCATATCAGSNQLVH